jgi:hypothetical protein
LWQHGRACANMNRQYIVENCVSGRARIGWSVPDYQSTSGIITSQPWKWASQEPIATRKETQTLGLPTQEMQACGRWLKDFAKWNQKHKWFEMRTQPVLRRVVYHYIWTLVTLLRLLQAMTDSSPSLTSSGPLIKVFPCWLPEMRHLI